jgi:hypothetical protein
MGSSITSTPVTTPKFLQNPAASIHKNGKMPKQSSKGYNLLALFAGQNHHGLLLCTWYPKKTDRGDYRRLNLVTTPDKYPLPNMQDLSKSLHGCKIFFKN